METALSIPIIMADQDGREPARPYVSYKILVEDVEHPRSNVISYEANSTTPGAETSDRKVEEISEASISLTIRGENQTKMTELYQTASSIFRYMKTQTDLVLLYDTSLEDRTTFIGAEYDYKIGFNFTINYCEKYTEETIERMNSVEITPTADEVEQPVFEVGRDTEPITKH
jgi:hypothetical protein